MPGGPRSQHGATAAHPHPGEVPPPDATARDRTEQRLLLERSRDAGSRDAVRRISGGLAHELNNLLTAITTSLELLDPPPPGDGEELPPESRRQLLRAIRGATDRATTLAAQLAALGGRGARSEEPLHLNDVVAATLDHLDRTTPESVLLQPVLHPELPLVVADRREIEQVVTALARHARDEIPDGGQVTVETSTREVGLPEATALGLLPGRYVSLAVHDSGAGLSPEAAEMIFEPFARAPGRPHHSGLALASGRAVADRCGGTITVETAPGAGTTLRLYLPAGAATVPGQPSAHPLGQPSGQPPGQPSARPAQTGRTATGGEAAVVPAPRPGGSRTVLLVDDDAGPRQVTRMALEREGFTVLEADGAAAALAELERHGDRIDLLLTDVLMPGMTGFDLADVASRRYPRLRRMFLSGYPDAPRTGGTGQDVVLTKPFTTAELLRSTAEALATTDGE